MSHLPRDEGLQGSHSSTTGPSRATGGGAPGISRSHPGVVSGRTDRHDTRCCARRLGRLHYRSTPDGDDEASVRANLLSLEATRQRHVGRSPHPERIDPETWESEYALLIRPGMIDIQLDLFHDYRTNVASYPKWQAYLRDVQPPTLVVWGKHDPSFTVAGAVAYGEDLPEAEIHLLDAGHFALDEAAPQIADLIRGFFAVRAPGAWGRRREHSPE